MRLDPAKSACSRAVRTAALTGLLFASGSGLFAFEQQQAPAEERERVAS